VRHVPHLKTEKLRIVFSEILELVYVCVCVCECVCVCVIYASVLASIAVPCAFELFMARERVGSVFWCMLINSVSAGSLRLVLSPLCWCTTTCTHAGSENHSPH